MATAPKLGASCAHDDSALDHNNADKDGYTERDLAFDPTLASCCERDDQEYKKAMKLKAILTAHDLTSGAVRMRHQLFQPPPAANATTPQDLVVPFEAPLQSRMSMSDSDDFDDSDDELGMETVLLAARRKQLKQQFHNAAQNAADGYGLVLDVGLLHLVHELRNEPDVPRMALIADSNASMEPGLVRTMRSEMAAVAQKFMGTKFYVAMVTAHGDDDVLRQLRLPSVSSLAAFRRGELVSSVALDMKTLVAEIETYWEARIVPWLTKCCVLTSERQISQQNSSNNPSRRKVGDEDETERVGFDCGVRCCRLRFGYEHEHVGASQQTKDEIAAWRQAPE